MVILKRKRKQEVGKILEKYIKMSLQGTWQLRGSLRCNDPLSIL